MAVGGALGLAVAAAGGSLERLVIPFGVDEAELVVRLREAFEQRLNTSLPLSDYLISELKGQADLSHADGRARFSELARPLLARLTEGVYRELVLKQIASALGIARERLEELTRVPPSTSAQSRAQARAARIRMSSWGRRHNPAT